MKHRHYFRDVSNLQEIDVYRVCDLFQVNDPSGSTQHAIKKLLLPGQRGGGKDQRKDLQEAVDTITRRIAMLEEDERVRTGEPETDPRWDQGEKRMEQIGPNGPTGEHYDDPHE